MMAGTWPNDVGGYTCTGCGAYCVGQHACPGRSPILPYQPQPLNPNIHLGPLPLTEDDARRIVREELHSANNETLARRSAPADAGDRNLRVGPSEER